MEQSIEFVKEFLELNGFIKIKENTFSKGKQCVVFIEDDHYHLHNQEGNVYSKDLNIYWLIGYLTYMNYINKKYILPE